MRDTASSCGQPISGRRGRRAAAQDRRASSRRARAGRARLRLQRNPAHARSRSSRVRGRSSSSRCRRSSRSADGPERAGVEVVGVPVNREYTHDLDAMLARVDAETRLVYICNPNNPTGRLTRRQDLEAFLRKLPAASCVLIDEAYHHYVGESPEYASFIDQPLDAAPRHRHAQLFQDLRTGGITRRVCRCRRRRRRASSRRAQLSDGVSVVAARAAVAALDDTEHVRTSVSAEHRRPAGVPESGDRADAAVGFGDQLRDARHRPCRGRGRRALPEARHSRVGPHARDSIKDIRVSLGTPAEMREFWRVWDLMIGHKMSM